MTSNVLVIWLKANLDPLLPGINNIVKAMKHTMSGTLSLKTFSIKLRGLRVWKAYDVGPCNCFTPAHDEWIWKTLRAYRPMS